MNITIKTIWITKKMSNRFKQQQLILDLTLIAILTQEVFPDLLQDPSKETKPLLLSHKYNNNSSSNKFSNNNHYINSNKFSSNNTNNNNLYNIMWFPSSKFSSIHYKNNQFSLYLIHSSNKNNRNYSRTTIKLKENFQMKIRDWINQIIRKLLPF